MMKRVLGALLVVASSLGVEAQVVDAFQGILPVTDPQMLPRYIACDGPSDET